MRKAEQILSIFSFVFLLTTQDAWAHTRRYVFNEEYRTIPQGEFEIENWIKLKVPDHRHSNVNSFEYQEELEYGLTDRWTLANYQIWETENKRNKDDTTVYKGFKFETKYRIGEKGKYWVDPLIYVEWIREVRATNENEFEEKLVLSKDFGQLNVNFNQVIESTAGSGGRTEHKFVLGSTYELPWEIHVGLEAQGDWWRPGSHRNRLALGPVLAWEGKHFWLASGVVFGLNHAADDVEARLIVGIPLPFDTGSLFKKKPK